MPGITINDLIVVLGIPLVIIIGFLFWILIYGTKGDK